MRFLPLLAISAVIFAAVLPIRSANAAPQVLGLVATGDTPTELTCSGGICSAEFSAVCLQQGRDAPKDGTLYQMTEGSALTMLVTSLDGAVQRLPASGLTITSARSHAAVTIRMPVSAMRAMSGLRVAIEVREGATLVPVPAAHDPAPQTSREIAAAVETFRKVGQATLADGSPTADGYRGMMAMINALPPGRKPAPIARESQLARAALDRLRMSAEARALTRERLEFCEQLTTGPWYAGGLRPCLQQQHDAFVSGKNNEYWNAADAGS